MVFTKEIITKEDLERTERQLRRMEREVRDMPGPAGLAGAAKPVSESRLYRSFEQLKQLTQRLDHVRDRLLGSSPPSATGETTGILMDGIESTLGTLADTVEAIETAI